MSIKTHTFPNGFRLIYERPKGTQSITSIYTYCDVGSIHEPDHIRGVSHFIEHMCFKGTPSIPKSKDLFIEYDKIGAAFNAFTTKRYTCYTIKCQDEYAAHSIDIVSDMLLNSTFPKKEFEKEYRVVIEENIRAKNDEDNELYDALDRMIYKGSSYELPEDSLQYHTKKVMNYESVIQYYHQYYRPDRIILSVTSNLSFEQIKRIVAKTYFTKQTGKRIDDSITNPINYSILPKSEIEYKMIHKKGVDNVLVAIGFRTCNQTSPDKYALNLLKRVIGGEMSGRMFTILREDNGLTYSSDATTEYFEHMGEFVIETQTDKTKLFKNGKKAGVWPLMTGLLTDLIQNGITAAELEIAKGNIKGQFIMNLEDTDTLSKYNGKRVLYNMMTPTVPYDKQYDTHYADITLTDIHNVIKRYFTEQNMYVCLLGEDLPNPKLIKYVYPIVK